MHSSACSGHPRYPGSIVPLLSCKGDISYHLSSYHISQKNIQSEGELLKLRAGMFNESDESLTVCPNHRYHLRLGWRCSRFCSLGWMCSKKNRANNKGTLTKEQSIFIFNTENNLIGVGSGTCICSKCRMVLLEKMRTTANEMCLAEEEYFIPVDEESKGAVSMQTAAFEEDNTSAVDVQETQSTVSDSQGSLWTPSNSQRSDTLNQNAQTLKRKALDDFLEICGVSPIKKSLTCCWETSSSRTQKDYVNKVKKIMKEVIHVLAPGQEDKISNAVYEEINEDIDMLEVVASAYKQSSNWGTQRQLLSIIASSYSLIDIQRYIPELTKYRFTAARKHAQSVGQGQPISKDSGSREKLNKEQISHFIDFIMTPAIMTDAPFGNMQLKLSSGQKIDVPKIILNSVRSRVVDQYQQLIAKKTILCNQQVRGHT